MFFKNLTLIGLQQFSFAVAIYVLCSASFLKLLWFWLLFFCQMKNNEIKEIPHALHKYTAEANNIHSR